MDDQSNRLDVYAASSALDGVSVSRTIGQSVAGLAWEVADYVRFGGDRETAAAMAEHAARAARLLGRMEGNRLADALDALRSEIGKGVRHG
jgi:hypothetical protein